MRDKDTLSDYLTKQKFNGNQKKYTFIKKEVKFVLYIGRREFF